MTTGPVTTDPAQVPDERRDDAIAVPLSLLLWGLVVIGLGYGVLSTLSKVADLFS